MLLASLCDEADKALDWSNHKITLCSLPDVAIIGMLCANWVWVMQAVAHEIAGCHSIGMFESQIRSRAVPKRQSRRTYHLFPLPRPTALHAPCQSISRGALYLRIVRTNSALSPNFSYDMLTAGYFCVDLLSESAGSCSRLEQKIEKLMGSKVKCWAGMNAPRASS